MCLLLYKRLLLSAVVHLRFLGTHERHWSCLRCGEQAAHTFRKHRPCIRTTNGVSPVNPTNTFYFRRYQTLQVPIVLRMPPAPHPHRQLSNFPNPWEKAAGAARICASLTRCAVTTTSCCNANSTCPGSRGLSSFQVRQRVGRGCLPCVLGSHHPGVLGSHAQQVTGRHQVLLKCVQLLKRRERNDLVSKLLALQYPAPDLSALLVSETEPPHPSTKLPQCQL